MLEQSILSKRMCSKDFVFLQNSSHEERVLDLWYNTRSGDININNEDIIVFALVEKIVCMLMPLFC